jgi:hypothetical protein
MKLRSEDISVKGKERTEINNFSDKIPNDILRNFFCLFRSTKESGFKKLKTGEPKSSVADPGCLFRIRLFSFPDPGSRIQIFSIPDSGSASKNLSILTQKNF